MKTLASIFRQHHGYARMRDLQKEGFHPREIAAAAESGTIAKVKRGLYKLTNYPWAGHSGFIDVCNAKLSAVICLASALEFHGLTTFNPSEIYVAVPHNTDKFTLEYPPVRVFYFPERFYSSEIQKIKLRNGVFSIYGKEKTICDMFRYRNKLGEDLAIEGLKTYLRSKGPNLALLQENAVRYQVKGVMLPYLRALVG